MRHDPAIAHGNIERSADSQCCITDYWREVLDPENERGEVVTAYFEHTTEPADDPDPRRSCGTAIVPRLAGVIVRGNSTLHMSANDATDWLGAAMVCLIERLHGVELNNQSARDPSSLTRAVSRGGTLPRRPGNLKG